VANDTIQNPNNKRIGGPSGLLRSGTSLYYSIHPSAQRRSREPGSDANVAGLTVTFCGYRGVRGVGRPSPAGKGSELMIKVKSRDNETVDQMHHRLKKLCEKEELIKDMKRVSYYEKPSEKKRRRLRKAQSRSFQRTLEG